MPVITFIVGNGLDLSLGINTRYRQFYDHIAKTKPDTNNRIYKSIQDEPETWADFEYRLGKHTDYIKKLDMEKRKAESIAFHDELDEIRYDLAEYLVKQEQSIENLPERFGFNARGIFHGLPSGQYDRANDLIQSSATRVDFITLNYTTTLEKILEDDRSFRELRWSHGAPLHLHGDLYADMTIGVSSEEQLYTGMSDAEKEDLIKPAQIISMNDGRMEKFRNQIAKSGVIVLYGSSIGSTDGYIWTALGKWLAQNQSRLLLVHKYDSNYMDTVRLSSRIQKRFISQVQDRILSFSNFSDAAKSSLKSQIYVIHNSDRLFYPKSDN